MNLLQRSSKSIFLLKLIVQEINNQIRKFLDDFEIISREDLEVSHNLTHEKELKFFYHMLRKYRRKLKDAKNDGTVPVNSEVEKLTDLLQSMNKKTLPTSCKTVLLDPKTFLDPEKFCQPSRLSPT